MRYRVTILDFTGQLPPAWERRNLTLAQAWRICIRQARRGRNMNGGQVVRENWGARGGDFPRAYRSATIHLDKWS